MAGIKNRCVLAIECRKCGEVFDMGYDIREEYEVARNGINGKRQEKESMLCWECRGN